MRILFVGGFYRGYLLAQRLIERGENVVGALVFEEDPHETDRYCERIANEFASRDIYVKATRKVSAKHTSLVRDELAPDVVFCLGWRTLIPTDVLAAAPLGGIAVHDSLLPKLRGFAPTNWGLLLGHDKLGATLFQLTDSVDAGDVYFQRAITPEPAESYQSIQRRIAEISVDLFDAYLDAAKVAPPVGTQQDDSQATYTCARNPTDGEIDWTASSDSIARLVRALGSPAPGAFTFYRGAQLVVEEARVLDSPWVYEGRVAGRVIDRDASSGTVDVLCGEGILRITKLRDPAGDHTSAAAVIKSVRESLGLNASQEVLQLRGRIEELEHRLANLEAPSHLRQAG